MTGPDKPWPDPPRPRPPQPGPPAASPIPPAAPALATPPSAGPAPTVRDPAAQPGTIGDLYVASGIAIALAVLGALLGTVWAAWSPTRPAAIVYGGGQFEVLAEDESLVAGDGRYLVITGLVGLLAALLVWFALPRRRGAIVLAGLVVGSAVGALLTELVGHLAGGGSFTGRPLLLTDGTRRDVTVHLPLSLHMPWLAVLQTLLAVLVYGLFVVFAARDDLGRPDPLRDRLRAAQVPAPFAPYGPWSVDPSDHPQGGGGHSNAPGALQQGDLPPQ